MNKIMYQVLRDQTSRGQCCSTTRRNIKPAFHNPSSGDNLKNSAECCSAIVSSPQILLENVAIMEQSQMILFSELRFLTPGYITLN